MGDAMKNPLHKKLQAIKEVQIIRGLELPVGLEFRQLVVTGPPGAGKTYYINQIGGWPNEGYLDLTKKGWWRDKTLVYRPREIHLGLPYKGFKEPLTVFDQEWLDAPADELAIDFTRISIPPQSHSLLRTNWKDRYIFEFVLPPPKQIYNQRTKRQADGYFPVDDNLSLDMVIRQADAYGEVALYLHRAGLNVYIRKDIQQAPMLISEKGEVALPPWAVAEIKPRASLKTYSGWKQLILRQSAIPWFTITNKLQELKRASRIPHDGKSFDVVIGRTHLRFAPEIPLGASKKYLRLHKNWIIRQPGSCNVKNIRGFARIKPEETVIIGRSNNDFNNLFNFSKDVAKNHVSVSNMRGDLLITPIDKMKSIKVVRLDDHDNREQIAANKISSMMQARTLLGSSIETLARKDALNLILEVNELLENESYRPLDSKGLPGGLLHLPDQQTPVIVGDLHAQVNNLLKILTENCLLEALASNKAILCILGDAVHSENNYEMESMDSSIMIMDMILTLKRLYPENIFYVRGNHDDFNPDLSKNGVPQGLLMKKALENTRGIAYVEAMQTFHERLPYMIVSDSFIACHAGPPRNGTKKKQIISIRSNPLVAKELTSARLKRPHYLSGYGKTEVKSLRKIFKVAKSTPVIVGHTPLDPFKTIWLNVGTIKNHHIVYSAHQQGPGLFVRIKGKMVSQSYPAEPLMKMIKKLEQAAS